MRATAMVAAAALMVAACGKKDAPATDAATQPPAAPAMAPTTGGTTHTIEMVQEGANSYKFKPETTTIKVGDTVIFKSVSGLSHNVAFVEDSIPPGAKPMLTAAVTGGPQDMSTPMTAEGSSVSVSFAGAPVGDYHFYCIPHVAMNMRGVIKVEQ